MQRVFFKLHISVILELFRCIGIKLNELESWNLKKKAVTYSTSYYFLKYPLIFFSDSHYKFCSKS